MSKTKVRLRHNKFIKKMLITLRCEYSNRGTLRKLTNQDLIWEQKIATFFVNGPMTFMNANNTFRTNLKTRQPLRVDADLSGSMSSFWLVTFDPKLLMFQRATCPHGKGFHIQWLFPNYSSEMESWGGHMYMIMVVVTPSCSNNAFRITLGWAKIMYHVRTIDINPPQKGSKER